MSLDKIGHIILKSSCLLVCNHTGILQVKLMLTPLFCLCMWVCYLVFFFLFVAVVSAPFVFCSEYAHGMGVYFQYALGGDVPDGVQDPGIQACIQTLNKCEGDSHCILIQRFFCGKRSFANKPLNFNANITAVRVAIKNSLAHLNWVCGGKW